MNTDIWLRYLVDGDRDLEARASVRSCLKGIEIPEEILSANRAVWRSVPVRALSPTVFDLQPYASMMANALFHAPTKNQVERSKTLLKRLTKYILSGRPMSLGRHRRKLLQLQRNRCACCGYFFSDADLSAADFEEEPFAERQIEGLIPPHVDHIIPVYVGPHRESNLQILCKYCNFSKGATLAWPLKPSFLRPLGPSDLLKSRKSILWLVRERDGGCTQCHINAIKLASPADRLEVVKISDNFGWILENLTTLCSSCFRKTIALQ